MLLRSFFIECLSVLFSSEEIIAFSPYICSVILEVKWTVWILFSLFSRSLLQSIFVCLWEFNFVLWSELSWLSRTLLSFFKGNIDVGFEARYLYLLSLDFSGSRPVFSFWLRPLTLEEGLAFESWFLEFGKAFDWGRRRRWWWLKWRVTTLCCERSCQRVYIGIENEGAFKASVWNQLMPFFTPAGLLEYEVLILPQIKYYIL